MPGIAQACTAESGQSCPAMDWNVKQRLAPPRPAGPSPRSHGEPRNAEETDGMDGSTRRAELCPAGQRWAGHSHAVAASAPPAMPSSGLYDSATHRYALPGRHSFIMPC